MNHNDGWTEWGFVSDREATLGVILALQADGWQVRVVRDGDRNIVYTKPRQETTS